MKARNPARITATAFAAGLIILCACKSGSDNAASAAPLAEVAKDGARLEATPQAPPPSEEVASSPRMKATADVVSATVMRVDGAAEATPGARLAGYLIRPDSERPLEPKLLQQLLSLVRSDSNFDDSIVTRCRPGVSVGFRLARRPAASDLVVDFGCNRLSVTDSQAGADIHATSFDPSRAHFVALVKEALPDDAELRSLR